MPLALYLVDNVSASVLGRRLDVAVHRFHPIEDQGGFFFSLSSDPVQAAVAFHSRVQLDAVADQGLRVTVMTSPDRSAEGHTCVPF